MCGGEAALERTITSAKGSLIKKSNSVNLTILRLVVDTDATIIEVKVSMCSRIDSRRNAG